jgi:uncharacterized membrane protein YhaH (DUF805 family)
MDFWSAVKSVFGKYVTFKGRACRSEWWFFYLFFVIVMLIADVIDKAILGSDIGIVGLIWALATLLPMLSVMARRLHDLSRTGWWILLIFVPIIGWIILLVWHCTRGTAGPNRFGEDPLT